MSSDGEKPPVPHSLTGATTKEAVPEKLSSKLIVTEEPVPVTTPAPVGVRIQLYESAPAISVTV